jgi:hypothetical protein
MRENNPVEFDPTGLDIEYLLENARFEPRPVFTQALAARLCQNLVRSIADRPSLEIGRIVRPPALTKRHTWQWVASMVMVVCLTFAALWITVPPVRAQVMSFFQRFGVRLPWVSEGIVISAFEPLSLTEVPPQMTHFMAHNWCFGALQDGGNCDGVSYTELRYFSQEEFIVIYETPVQTAGKLPLGERLTIGNNDAVLHRYLSGVIRLAAPAPQTWRVNGGESGGGGGGGGSSDDPGPSELPYSGAVELIWHQAGVHIELLTNLPLDEAKRLAGSMQPAASINKP